MKPDIRILNNSDPLWQQVFSLKEYSIYHTKDWKNFIEKTFHHTPLYLSASSNRHLIDLLPFFLIKQPGLGAKLISTPYEACHGSFLSLDTAIHRFLTENVLEYATKSKVGYVEIRSKRFNDTLKSIGFQQVTPFITTQIELKDIDRNWKTLSTKHRRNVRSAGKKGVQIRLASTVSDMDAFYRIVQKHYKAMGVPFFNKRFFRQIWQSLIKTDCASLLVSELENEIIGGHLLLHSGDTLISKYAAHKKHGKYKSTYASYASYWSAIEFGIQHNYQYFNCGITGSSNEGLIKFKSSFGGTNSPTYFYDYPITGKAPDLAKYYGEYFILKRVWSILPTFFTSFLGQKINAWLT